MNKPLWHVCSGRSDEQSVALDAGLPGPCTNWPQDDRGNSHTPRDMQQRKNWQVGITVINKGDPWLIPTPVMAHFVLITWRNAAGVAVISQHRPARFRTAEFLSVDPTKPDEQNYFSITKENPFGGQVTDITDLPDGDYDVTMQVDPECGESVEGGICTVTYELRGENCNLKAPLTFGTFRPSPAVKAK